MAIKEKITPEELQALSEGKVVDAAILLKEGRFDTAYYLCGYAIELALKRRICLTLDWDGFPKKDFPDLGSFKTHKLAALLTMSGYEKKIKKDHLSIWSVVVDWDPEVRYSSQGVDQQVAEVMLALTKSLLEVL
jgi:hypothetical protein